MVRYAPIQQEVHQQVGFLALDSNYFLGSSIPLTLKLSLVPQREERILLQFCSSLKRDRNNFPNRSNPLQNVSNSGQPKRGSLMSIQKECSSQESIKAEE